MPILLLLELSSSKSFKIGGLPLWFTTLRFLKFLLWSFIKSLIWGKCPNFQLQITNSALKYFIVSASSTFFLQQALHLSISISPMPNSLISSQAEHKRTWLFIPNWLQVSFKLDVDDEIVMVSAWASVVVGIWESVLAATCFKSEDSNIPTRERCNCW